MAKDRSFEIAFVGLKPGVHEYVYEVDDKFFAEKGVTDFTNCTATVKLSLDKKTGFMMLKFEVSGKATGTCDRCSNPLPINIWDEFNMVIKLVDYAEEMNNNEDDPDVFYLNRTESHLNVENWVYEFILLSIPTQRMCEKIGGPYCNKEVLEKLNQMKDNVGNNQSNDVWKGLEKFKTKN